MYKVNTFFCTSPPYRALKHVNPSRFTLKRRKHRPSGIAYFTATVHKNAVRFVTEDLTHPKLDRLRAQTQHVKMANDTRYVGQRHWRSLQTKRAPSLWKEHASLFCHFLSYAILQRISLGSTCVPLASVLQQDSRWE